MRLIIYKVRSEVLFINFPVSIPDSVPINAADTLAFTHFELNETLIAPTRSPRVLDLPIVGVALIIQSIRHIFAAYPPVVDATLSYCIAALRVAYDYDAVVDCKCIFITASVSGFTAALHNTAFVISELWLRGIECDSTRLLHNFLFHLLKIIIWGIIIAFHISINLICVMSTILMSSPIWIVRIEHGTLLLHEFPRTCHPTTITASLTIGFAEHFSIFIGI